MPAVSGDYLVRTTWREILLAAVMVGRDPTPWLGRLPQLARLEILARVTPLRAYLCRVTEPGRSGAVVKVNDVYVRGTERSAKAAFGYRIGMTMAEWICWAKLGMSHSRHSEIPPGASGPTWRRLKTAPDLFGVHPTAPHNWVVEAKAQRQLGHPKLKEGAEQLALDGLISSGHRRVLCGTSLERQLFMTVDIDTRHAVLPAQPIPGRESMAQRTDLYHRARSAMLTYLTVRTAALAGQATIVPVGLDESLSWWEASQISRLETDDGTQEVRAIVAGTTEDRRGGMACLTGIDMLAARIPGTGLTVGMSRKLYAACDALFGWLTEIAPRGVERAYILQPEREEDAAEANVAERDPDTDHAVETEFTEFRQQEQERRSELVEVAQERYDDASGQEWREILGLPVLPRVEVEPGTGQVECATSDLYLAVDETALPPNVWRTAAGWASPPPTWA